MIEYAVARVHGFRRHLLGIRGLAELAAQRDLEARLELLRRLGLVAGRDLSLREAERELRGRLAHDIALVDGLLEGTRARNHLRSVLSIGDAWTLKTVMRGLERAEPSARLLSLLQPTLELDEAALKELVAQRGVKPMLALLASWSSPYAAPLLAAIEKASGQIDPQALEIALDRHVVARAVERGGSDPAVADLLAEIVDLTNAVTLLKLAGKIVDPELFLAGGARLPADRFRRLGALSAAELQAELAADRRLRIEAAFVDGKVDSLRLERLQSRRPLVALRRAARIRPLGVAAPLLYVLERQEEARAIRLILEGGELGLPGGELLDWVEGTSP